MYTQVFVVTLMRWFIQKILQIRDWRQQTFRSLLCGILFVYPWTV